MAAAYQIDLQTPRSIREIVAAMLVLYRRYPLLFTILAVAVVAPYDLAFMAITGYGPRAALRHHAALLWLDRSLRDVLVLALIAALHVHAVVAIGGGQRPRLRTVALRGIQVLPVVAATAVITYVGALVGLILLIVPGIVLGLMWAVSAQAAALEHQGPLAALRSSQHLTWGHYWHIAGLELLSGCSRLESTWVSTRFIWAVHRASRRCASASPSSRSSHRCQRCPLLCCISIYRRAESERTRGTRSLSQRRARC